MVHHVVIAHQLVAVFLALRRRGRCRRTLALEPARLELVDVLVVQVRLHCAGPRANGHPEERQRERTCPTHD